ncbi:MAG TPA: hypothetical protein VFG03_16630 [Telluria sp.]|nr:hypothetical protein [Telluria sp.]
MPACAMAQRHQVGDRRRRGGGVVDRNRDDAIVALVRALDVEGDHRAARRHRDQVVGVVQCRAGDDALHAVGQQVGHHRAFAVGIAEGAEGHHVAMVPGRGRFHRAGKRAEELVGQRRYQQADHGGDPGLELARRIVGPVPELLDRVLDLELGCRPHLLHPVVEEIRDTGRRHAGQPRHILNFWLAHRFLLFQVQRFTVWMQ